MKKILLGLLGTIASVSAADLGTPSQPDWISIKPTNGQEFLGRVDAEVTKDKGLRRGIKDFEFLRNILTYKFNIDQPSIDALSPWISRSVDNMNAWGTKYLVVQFSDVAPLIAAKLGGSHTTTSILEGITSEYAAAKADRKKRKELSLLSHIAQSLSYQDPSFNFENLKQMWFEDRGNPAMPTATKQAYMSSKSIIDPYNASAATAISEYPIKVELADVYTLLSRRFEIDYTSQVGALKAELKAFKTEQRYMIAAYRLLKAMGQTDQRLAPTDQTVTPQKYQTLLSLLGSYTFYNPEIRDMLPTLFTEFQDKQVATIMLSITGTQYSANRKFIMKAQSSEPQYNSPNIPDLGDPQTLIQMRDGKLYRGNSVIADDMTHNLIYAVDRLGNLCIQVPGSTTTPNHDRFFTVDGVGQPIACGGHISIQGGKIIKIDPMSGHYMPATLQMFLMVKYLNEKGVVAPNCVVVSYESGSFSLQEVLAIADRIEFKA